MKTLVTLLLAISLNTQASQADITAIEQAAMSLDTQQLTILVEQNSGYEKAFALYNLSIAKNLHAEQEQAIKSLDSAISELENLTEQTPNDDEVRVLLALTYGLKTVYQPMKAADYGPKSGQALAKALSLNQNNPRAYLVKGISKYNTPAMYGGSKTAALTALDQAIALYSQEFEQGNSSDKVWGEANAHVWRGLANISLNNKSQALTDWHNALAISPNFGWAKMLIQQNQ